MIEVDHIKKEVEDILKNDGENKFIDFILISDEEDKAIIYASDGVYEMVKFDPFDHGHKDYEEVLEWDFSVDDDIFAKLESGFHIGYMSDECHLGIWSIINNTDIDHIDGFDQYISYCKEHDITKEYLDDIFQLDVEDITSDQEQEEREL